MTSKKSGSRESFIQGGVFGLDPGRQQGREALLSEEMIAIQTGNHGKENHCVCGQGQAFRLPGVQIWLDQETSRNLGLGFCAQKLLEQRERGGGDRGRERDR